MSKTVFKHKKVQILLEPDSFSIHTFELSIELSKSEWNKYKDQLYTEQEDSNEILQIVGKPDKSSVAVELYY